MGNLGYYWDMMGNQRFPGNRDIVGYSYRWDTADYRYRWDSWAAYLTSSWDQIYSDNIGRMKLTLPLGNNY